MWSLVKCGRRLRVRGVREMPKTPTTIFETALNGTPQQTSQCAQLKSLVRSPPKTKHFVLSSLSSGTAD